MTEKYYMPAYVGVSDVPSFEAIKELGKSFQSLCTPLRLKAGVTMTRKVLWGIPSKWKHVCPQLDDIPKIFKDTFIATTNVVHYADYDGVDLEESFLRILEISGPHLQGVQFDMIWPDIKILEQCKARSPKLQFILQVGTNALQEVDNNPFKLWQKFEPYTGIVERVLLDKSMGQGRTLSPRVLLRYVDILYERMKEPGVVVAGGLGPDTLECVEPLLAIYPFLSIDAQGQLRTSGKTLDGPIDMERTKRYVEQARAMHHKYNPA